MDGFTKGPWIVSGPSSGYVYVGPASLRGLIWIPYSFAFTNPNTPETVMPVAHFASAAPDMYEALQLMLDKFDDMKPCGKPTCKGCIAIAAAKTAMAKARPQS